MSNGSPSVYSSILLPMDLDPSTEGRCKLAVGLADRAKDKPATFSGGMKRRMLVAKALVHNPPVLELDEPFRSTLLLRYVEGRSAADIARRQGVPAGTVRWRLKAALDDVRARFGASTGEPLEVAVGEAGGVGEEVAHRDPLAAGAGELRDDPAQRRVQVEPRFVHELHHLLATLQ